MKKFLSLFLILFVLNVNFVFAKSVKISVMSDVHIVLTRDADGNFTSNQSIRNAQRAIKEINSSNSNYVIITGDCIDTASVESAVMFSKIINKLNKPYYVILGNHDVSITAGLNKKKFFKLVNRFSKNRIRKVPTVKNVDNDLVFIFMDGVNQMIPGAMGNFKEEELNFLDKKLKKYKNKNVVIFQHFPLVEPYTNKSHRIYNAKEYEEILSKHNNVRAIVTGHYHAEAENLKDGIYHLSSPALKNGEYKVLEFEYGNLKDEFVVKSKVFNVN